MKEIKKLIICRGIQASGKSTFAKKWVLEDKEHRIRINMDDIRLMLGGSKDAYWVPKRENLVKEIKEDSLRKAMMFKYDIIIDNMNLNPKETSYYETTVKLYNARSFDTEYVIEYRDFFGVSLEECIERDKKRDNPIGEAAIRGTYNKYKDLFK